MRATALPLQIPGMDDKTPTLAWVRDAYQAAADCHDQPPLAFWDSFGRATVARLSLRPGHHVLDVCCGSGSSAIPAAVAVGANGRVIGVDLAAGLLDLARTKAARAKLEQAEFFEGNFEDVAEPGGTFDAVVCVLGMFAVPEVKPGVQRLWRWVRPGGSLAITAWGPRILEPLTGIFWDAIRGVRPEFTPAANPWEAFATPATVMALFRGAGISSVVVESSPGEQALRTPDDGWTIVMGSWLRGAVESLTLEERARVRAAVLHELENRKIARLETNVIYAVARKP